MMNYQSYGKYNGIFCVEVMLPDTSLMETVECKRYIVLSFLQRWGVTFASRARKAGKLGCCRTYSVPVVISPYTRLLFERFRFKALEGTCTSS